MTEPAPRENLDVGANWEVRVPPALLFLGPVLIGLFCLVISLGSYSVFEGFDEEQPGTDVNVLLMVGVWVLAVAALRHPGLDRPTRGAAGVIALVTMLAILDETFNWHENIGKYIRRNLEFVPPRLGHYSDDLLVLGGALLGGLILYGCIRRSGRARELRGYVWVVVGLGVAHGLLDIASHNTYVVEWLRPEASRSAAKSTVARLHFYEELCKTWCSWFVILFLMRFFHGCRGYGWWSLMIGFATAAAALGLWGTVLMEVPYITIGRPLLILRNFPAVLMLSFAWLTWALIFRLGGSAGNGPPRAAAILFLSPLAVLLVRLPVAGGVGAAMEWLADRLPNGYYGAGILRHLMLAAWLVLPGTLAGVVAGRVVCRYPRLLVVALLAPLALIGVAVEFSAGSSRWWLELGAGIVMLAGGFLLGVPRLWTWVAGLLLVGASTSLQPLWLAAVLPGAVIGGVLCGAPSNGRRVFVVTAGVALLTGVTVALSSNTLLPNGRYRPHTRDYFRVGYQPVEGDHGD